MKFVLDADQRLFADTLSRLLAQADTPKAIRTRGIRPLWETLAGTGLFSLAVPEIHDGAGMHPVELVIAAHELGRHAAPGPYVETIASAVLLSHLGGELTADWLPRISAGSAIVTLAVPYALDADIADLTLDLQGGQVHTATLAEPLPPSLDPARRLFRVTADSALGSAVPVAYDLGVLLCAAQQLGLGRFLLDTTVAYAKTRHQFGRPIGEFQAVKHQLADALVALEFARPLIHGAALAYDSPTFARDVSAAKVAASEAAYQTAKTALQLHGAIGYTDEYDPSLWIRKVRALHTAWGTVSSHRARVLARCAV